MLAILDFVFNRMLEKQLKPEAGLKLLKDLLSNHSIQRPPYQIFIFTETEVADIVSFSMTTFLRHFSLYEFAFKPRVELVLRSDPVFNTMFNTELGSLDQMQEVEDEEAEQMKAFLKQMKLDPAPSNNQSRAAVDNIVEQAQQLDMQEFDGETGHITAAGQESQVTAGGDILASHQHNNSSALRGTTISASEKKRIGKVYQKDQALDQVVAAEMARIRQAFDKRVVDHTDELLTKVQSGQPLNPNRAADAAAAGASKKK